MREALKWLVVNFHITLLILVVVGFGGFAVYRSHVRSVGEERVRREAELGRKRQDELQARQIWAEIPVTESLPTGQPPPVPELPSVSDPDWFRERLRVLVQNHPEEVVRKGMDEAVKSGQLLLNPQTGMMAIAEFKAVKRSDVTSSGWNLDDREVFPTFAFSPQQLAALQTTEDVREAMLVVYHENVHYQQWLGQSPEKRVIATYGTEIDPNNVAKACTFMWEAELDAYGRECQIANSWGMGGFVDGLCRKVSNRAAFSQHLFWLMGNPNNPPAKYCTPMWARLAGHPNPDSFK